MPDNVFGYGLAIDFMGNYAREGKAAEGLFSRFDKLLSGFGGRANRELGMSENAMLRFVRNVGRTANGINEGGINRLNSALTTLRNLVIGGAIAAGFNALKNKIMQTGQSLETMYASLDTVFHDPQRTQGLLKWASKKAVDTPFEMLDVSQAVTSLASMGKAKNNTMLDKNFTAIGDFAASKSIDLGRATQMVTKASFGNWESLGDSFGIRLSTLMSMATNAVGKNRAELIKLAKTLQTAKAGTDEYSTSVIKFLGLYAEGGMQKRVKTVAGAISNLHDLVSNFFVNMVGLSQVEGTLFNGIGKSLNNILGIFDRVKGVKVYDETGTKLLREYNRELTQTERLEEQRLHHTLQDVTVKDQLFSIAEKSGAIVLSLWNGVSGQIMKVGDAFAGFIDKLDKWSNDFPGKVAPMIVFLTLLKFKIQDMAVEFKNGFNDSFGLALDLVKAFGRAVIWAYNVWQNTFGGEKAKTEGMTTANLVGKIVGGMLGLKLIRVIASPFGGLISGARTLWGWIAKLIGTEAGGAGVSMATRLGRSWGWLTGGGLRSAAGAAGEGLAGAGSRVMTGAFSWGAAAKGGLVGLAPAIFGSGGMGTTGYGEDEYKKMGFANAQQYGKYRVMAKAAGIAADDDLALESINGREAEFRRYAASGQGDAVMNRRQLKMLALRDQATGRAAAPVAGSADGGHLPASMNITTLNVYPDTKNGGLDLDHLHRQLGAQAAEINYRKGIKAKGDK